LTIDSSCDIINIEKGGNFMIIYQFSNFGNRISREEIEVTEKQNVYEVSGSNGKKRIKKSAINVLTEGYSSVSMYSLVENPEHFLAQVIAHKKAAIDALEISLATLKNDIIGLTTTYGGFISDNVWENKYHPRGELVFSINENGQAIGKPVENDNMPADTLHMLTPGNPLVYAIEQGVTTPQNTIIHMIYVNGKHTNLTLDGYETYCTDVCSISLEKFVSLCNKFKVEVDYSLKG
jgi:hypothetical protein